MANKRISIVIVLASLVGFIASFLSWQERVLLLAGITPTGSLCSISSVFNCQAVSISRYALFMNIPLAVWGMAFYLAMIVTGLYVSFQNKQLPGRTFKSALILSTLGSLLFSVYLFYISKFVLGALCLYCIIMYAANLILFVCACLLFKGHKLTDLLSGLDAPFQIVKSIVFNESQARWFSLIGLALVIITLLSHQSFHKFIVPQKTTLISNQTLSRWQALPSNTIPMQLDGSVITKDYSRGSAKDGDIEIVEFSDIECGACRNFHQTVSMLLDKYPQKIRVSNKFFPLDKNCNRMIEHDMHQNSCFASSFVRCAGEQGAYWKAFDHVFVEPTLDMPSSKTMVTSSLFSWAKENDLDLEGLSECVTSERQLQKIKEDIDLGIKMSVEQTPTFFVNGKKTDAHQLADIIEALINK